MPRIAEPGLTEGKGRATEGAKEIPSVFAFFMAVKSVFIRAIRGKPLGSGMDIAAVAG